MTHTHFICNTCGCQYEAAALAPATCIICADDRQYVGPGGQRWTTLAAVNAQHRNVFELVAPDVFAIYTTPNFGINQRAHLICTPQGNVLWDCITNLDASTKAIIDKLGGIGAIALSHPHYFSTIIEWSEAFDAPVYVNEKDAGWLTRTGPRVSTWREREQLAEGMTLIECGGHFPGASVLHWARGKGILFSGDTIQVAPNRSTVSFMYSYPNMIPLPKREIERILSAVAPFDYEEIYGAFGLYIREDAKGAVRRSAARYVEALS
ncbi:MBL fold metallo-hydrolase [Flaviaesturariibacter flavus]|uniref:MBL fold metallo-hydrolase n=1 Tax=Flaviaesturariibacter flavus TaxID=2502780 RepID=A0A4R1B2Z5_9BACT|nr:MBL fold metallo-hydrolase [Flaviaesturariibacter flavus]TCJ12442.1 MBL fold metallo-hydrolase [Flaviaesturariibacter flavus]